MAGSRKIGDNNFFYTLRVFPQPPFSRGGFWYIIALAQGGQAREGTHGAAMANIEQKILTSATSRMHYCKLVFRSCLFLAALALYVVNRVRGTGMLFGGMERRNGLLIAIWVVFVLEMILRFFPSNIESMGCQKQFARNYLPTGTQEPPKVQPMRITLFVAALWIVFNGLIGLAYFLGLIDAGILLLISLAFSVCDMICILFFCPFQTWIMKNKCCGSCRIYNWDYAMMFTPLVFIKSAYTWSLLGLALLLLISWEALAARHPERFAENTNRSLACANCKERLCSHKRSLQAFLRKHIEHRWRQPEGGLDKVK